MVVITTFISMFWFQKEKKVFLLTMAGGKTVQHFLQTKLYLCNRDENLTVFFLNLDSDMLVISNSIGTKINSIEMLTQMVTVASPGPNSALSNK